MQSQIKASHRQQFKQEKQIVKKFKEKILASSEAVSAVSQLRVLFSTNYPLQ